MDSVFFVRQWNLDSWFQSSKGFRIPWAVFRIPKPRILVLQAKVLRIPDFTSQIFPDFGIFTNLIPRSPSCLYIKVWDSFCLTVGEWSGYKGNNKNYIFLITHTAWSVARRDRLVVRTLRCGRSNPGSNPGLGSIYLLLFLIFISFCIYSIFSKKRFKVNVMSVLRDQMNDNIWSIIFSAILTKTFQVDLFISCKLAILAMPREKYLFQIKSVTSFMDRYLTILDRGKRHEKVHGSQLTIHITVSLSKAVKGRFAATKINYFVYLKPREAWLARIV